MILNWQIRNWIKQMLPPMVRGENTIAWLYSLLKPIETLYGYLVTFRLTILNKMSYNGQTIILRTLLNELYDSTLKRIFIITENDLLPDNYIYTAPENTQPLYIFTKTENTPTYIYTALEYINGFEFLVKVPTGILTAAQEIRLKATVNYYRIAGKRPKFIYDNGTEF